MRSEANLLGRWKLVRGKKANLSRVVACLERTANNRGPVQDDDPVLARIIEVTVDTKQGPELNNQPCLLAHLASRGLLHIVAIFDKAARDVPAAFPWLEFTPSQQQCA